MPFIQEKMVKIRKAHRCEGCSRRIEAGETAMRWKGCSDDGFQTAYYHPDCREWECFLNKENGLNGDEWYLLHEHVADGGIEVLHDAPQAVKSRFQYQPSQSEIAC